MPEDLDKPCNGTRSTMGLGIESVDGVIPLPLKIHLSSTMDGQAVWVMVVVFLPYTSLPHNGSPIEPTKLRVGKHKVDAKACRGKDPQEIVLEMIVWIYVDYESN
ncbi:hypothetical protein B0H16DRAFT_1450653 [Mycena metata]|uniref:Uncharacterized protein n=1 Tax=Mycena metata TaxID=1033252 RepID=A0AAD7NSJ9_9AGAR|nr:hypothetical protein B0H16DRAFT_1450653 [Mycena metata]